MTDVDTKGATITQTITINTTDGASTTITINMVIPAPAAVTPGA